MSARKNQDLLYAFLNSIHGGNVIIIRLDPITWFIIPK